MLSGKTSNLWKINLSQNFIGLKYLSDSKIIELKMQNQDLIKNHTFDDLFYDAQGLRIFTDSMSFQP